MDDYNRLNTEDEKQLFLRNEIARHNTTGGSSKNAGVTDSLNYAMFQKPRLQGFVWWPDAKGIHNRKGLKKAEDTGSHGQHRIGFEPLPRHANGRKAAEKNIKGNKNICPGMNGLL